jgi:hypothetical protein
VSGWSRDSRRWPIVIGVILLAFAVYIARWYVTPSTQYGDTYYYLALSYDFAGQTEHEGRVNAATYMCRSQESADSRLACVDGWLAVPERYYSIFESRIGYPAVSAPFVGALGPSGLAVGAAVLGILWIIVLALAVRVSGGSIWAALIATGIAYILPTGQWATANLAEGGVYLGVTTFLLGSLLVMRGSLSRGIALLAAAILWLMVTKSSSAVAVGISVFGAAIVVTLVAMISRDSQRRFRALVLLAVGAASVALVISAMALLDQPGLGETLQDLYTNHFQSPDIDDPMGRLIEDLPVFLRHRIGLLRDNPLPLVVLAVSLTALFWMAKRLEGRGLPIALVWAAVGMSGIPLIMAHPVNSEVPRLISVVWLPVAAGFAATVTGEARSHALENN